MRSSGWCGREETGENAPGSWNTCMGANSARLRGKRETASKVDRSRSVSEVDAYKLVSLFPLHLGCVPKTPAFFSCFLCRLGIYSLRNESTINTKNVKKPIPISEGLITIASIKGKQSFYCHTPARGLPNASERHERGRCALLDVPAA